MRYSSEVINLDGQYSFLLSSPLPETASRHMRKFRVRPRNTPETGDGANQNAQPKWCQPDGILRHLAPVSTTRSLSPARAQDKGLPSFLSSVEAKTRCGCNNAFDLLTAFSDLCGEVPCSSPALAQGRTCFRGRLLKATSFSRQPTVGSARNFCRDAAGSSASRATQVAPVCSVEPQRLVQALISH